MIWFIFFIFSLAALNSVAVYNLLKKAGFEDPFFLIFSGLALVSACLCYKIAIGG